MSKKPPSKSSGPRTKARTLTQLLPVVGAIARDPQCPVALLVFPKDCFDIHAASTTDVLVFGAEDEEPARYSICKLFADTSCSCDHYELTALMQIVAAHEDFFAERRSVTGGTDHPPTLPKRISWEVIPILLYSQQWTTRHPGIDPSTE